jgi:hypothetical protein
MASMLVRSHRLYLRQATIADVDVFFAMDSDPEVMRCVVSGYGPVTC